MKNLIVTAYRKEGRYLLRELSKYGKFTKTGFRDVVVGEVENVDEFLDKIIDEPPLSLARVIPVKEFVEFKEPDKLLKVLEKKMLKYKFKGSFRVTVERRGWKEEINSYEWAKKLGALIHEKNGNPVSLESPDVEVVIEVMSDWCGLTTISKELKDKYYFVRTK